MTDKTLQRMQQLKLMQPITTFRGIAGFSFHMSENNSQLKSLKNDTDKLSLNN